MMTTSGCSAPAWRTASAAVAGLADHLELAVALERVPQALADQVVIVDEQHLGAGRSASGLVVMLGVTPLLVR